MGCPQCGSENIVNGQCQACQANIAVIQKLQDLSNLFYNKGLAQTKKSDLSGAIVSLKKSIELNKRNDLARNVLGLIYFEIGQIGAAYKQWQWSMETNTPDNRAQKYLNEIGTNLTEVERLNSSVKMYNQALVYLTQKSEDMAIIQLKKAMEINPKFISAMNLLTLCYMMQNDKAKAAALTEKVLEVDCNNVTALRYRREVVTTQLAKQMETKKDRTPGKSKSSPSYAEVLGKGAFGKFTGFTIVYIVTGLIVGFFMCFMLTVPAINASNKELLDDYKGKLVAMTLEKTTLEQTNSTTIADLESAKTELEKKNKALEEKVTVQDNIQNLNRASELVSDGNYEEASVVLGAINKASLPADLADKLDQLINRAYPRTANILYSRALSKYRAKAYDEAVIIFNDCLKYAPEDSSQAGDSRFYLGEIAAAKEDHATAKNYYEEVVNKYKNAKNYWTAKNRLSNME